MTKYRDFCHRLLEKIENFLDLCSSFELHELLDHSNESSDLLRKVANKTSIKIDKAHKDLYFLEICRTCSVDYDFHLLRIHAKIVH